MLCSPLLVIEIPLHETCVMQCEGDCTVSEWYTNSYVDSTDATYFPPKEILLFIGSHKKTTCNLLSRVIYHFTTTVYHGIGSVLSRIEKQRFYYSERRRRGCLSRERTYSWRGTYHRHRGVANLERWCWYGYDCVRGRPPWGVVRFFFLWRRRRVGRWGGGRRGWYVCIIGHHGELCVCGSC